MISRRLQASTLTLGGFLLLFVGSRLLYLILMDPDPVSLFHLMSEELYRGTIAQELVTGLTLPFTEYRADDYSGGSLVTAVFAAGFFLLLGPTLFALKLAPLVFFTLALVFWYRTLQQYAGERVAGYFAMLFCFSPPLFTTYSVTTMGFHSESIMFSALTVLLLFRMLSEEKPSLAYPMLLGLTAGFGLWFAYIYGLTLLAMLAFWVWHDTGVRFRPRVLGFALGFVVGFCPWILINVQTDFAGLVIYDKPVWQHFGLNNLWDGLSHPRRLAVYEFFAGIAFDDPRDLPQRAANLLYSFLFLAPILTVAVIHPKVVRSEPVGGKPTRFTLEGFGTLYLVVFVLAVQFSDFKAPQYSLPAYPFLFVLSAYSLARCQDLVPDFQRTIQTVFLGGAVVLGLGAHAPLLSLERAGATLSSKGYAYALLPLTYFDWEGRGQSLELVEQPFLSDILPKLSSDDQEELSRGIAVTLAYAASRDGQAEDFARIERLIPPGFDNEFAYWLGWLATARHPNDLAKAVGAVEFLRHRSTAAHHLALISIYRSWPMLASLDASPESLANSTAPMSSDLSPHYWRAFGHLAGRYWYDRDRSLEQLSAHVQSFVPRLNPSVQQCVLQGVGELLLTHFVYTSSVSPTELERFPHAYQEYLLEGWGMALRELDLFYQIPRHGPESPLWKASTKGLSVGSLVSVRQGRAQFDAFFEGPALRAMEPPRNAH